MRAIAILLTFLLAASASAETITIAAAISLKDSLDLIGKAYEAKSGDRLIFNFDASGKLARQIHQGAPVDAFISADGEQVDKLIKSGDVNVATRRTIVRNTLVLIAPADEKNAPGGFNDLANGRGKIAIGDPQGVPAGRYAMQVFHALKIAATIAPRLVLAENVREVLMYVQRGEVDAGIVYGTDAKIAGATVRLVATADESTHEPIEYPAVIVTHSTHAAAAAKFLNGLTSESSQAAFIKFGFERPAASSSTTRPTK